MPDIDLDIFKKAADISAPTGIDLDVFKQAADASAPDENFYLRRQKEEAARASERALKTADALDWISKNVVWSPNPLETVVRGTSAMGHALAGGIEDVGLTIGGIPSTENIRSALFSNEPTPTERELSQMPPGDVGAALTRGGLGLVRSVPTLFASGILGPEVMPAMAPALFGLQTYAETGDPSKARTSALIGAAYPVVGQAANFLSGGIIKSLIGKGLISQESTGIQKAIESGTEAAFMQAATHAASLPEYAQMTPEQRKGAIAENAGSILLFSLPRLVSYARGAPSEFQHTPEYAEFQRTVQDESQKMADYYRGQSGAGEYIPPQPKEEPSQMVGRAIERVYGASTPTRRLAARFAQEQGIPVDVQRPVGEMPRETNLGERAAQALETSTTEQYAPSIRQQRAAEIPLGETPESRPQMGEGISPPGEAPGTRPAIAPPETLPPTAPAQAQPIPVTGPFTTNAQLELARPTPFNLKPLPDGTIPGNSLLQAIPKFLTKDEWAGYQAAGIDGLLKDKRVSPQQLNQWIQDNGVRVEVKTFRGGDVVAEAVRRQAEIQHEMETMGFDLTRETGTPNLVHHNEQGWVHVDAMPDRARRLYNEYQRLAAVEEDVARGVGGNPATLYRGVSPKDVDQTVIAVVKPSKVAPGGRIIPPHMRYQYDIQFPSTHSFPPNTLGWVRGYMETLPNGRKIFHIIEVQSDWADRNRQLRLVQNASGSWSVNREGQTHSEATFETKQEAEQWRGSRIAHREYGAPDDPLLRDWERLVLKAAVQHAIGDGADEIAVSDAKTAMMTEGHDRQQSYIEASPQNISLARSIRHEPEIWGKLDTYNRERIEGLIRREPQSFSEVNPYLADLGFQFSIPQAKGMTLHYDVTLPSIVKDITGEEGRRVNFGEHKMAFEKEHPGNMVEPTQRKDLIFREPTGEPKTTATGLSFDLAKVKQRGTPFTLFGSDTIAPERVSPIKERLSLPNNTARTLPELKLEQMARTDKNIPDWHTGAMSDAQIVYNPIGIAKSYISIRAPGAKLTSYKIPLDQLPQGTWEKTDQGLVVDRKAILDFLNDNERRFENAIKGRAVKHYLPQDIDAIRNNTQPVGHPSLGKTEAAEAGIISLDQPVPGAPTRTLHEIIGPQPPEKSQQYYLSKKALDDLEKRNPRLVAQMEDKRPEELDEDFWNKVKAELTDIEGPQRAAALTESLRSLKESGTGIEPLMMLSRAEQPAVARAAQEATDLQEARKLVDHPDNGLSTEARGVLRDVLDGPIAKYLNGRAIRFRLVDAIEGLPGASGVFNPMQQLIEVARSGDPYAAAHEFFHPLWEMLKPEDRALVAEWRGKVIDYLLSTSEGKDLQDLRTLALRQLNTARFQKEQINPDFYPLSRPEEFFAYMMTEKFQRQRQGFFGTAREILTSQDTFINKVKDIVHVLVDSLRKYFPAFQDDLSRLAQNILSGKYEVRPETAFPTRSRARQAMFESREKVEEFIRPLEERVAPPFFREMASVLNKGLAPPTAVAKFTALPMTVQMELKDVFPGRIETQRPGPTFQELLADPKRTPQEKALYAHHALSEWLEYQGNKNKVLTTYDRVTRTLDKAIIRQIEIIPEVNEAEYLSNRIFSGIIDKIQNERVKSAEGAITNTKLMDAMEHVDDFRALLTQKGALSNAMTGIANLVGRRELTQAKPGEEILQLISEKSGFPGTMSLDPEKWVSELASHLYKLETPEGKKVISAGEGVIESTLHGLRQLADARGELLQMQMAQDGTVKKVALAYLEDLKAKEPKGFKTILDKYATAKVESDALLAASKRLTRRVDALVIRKTNLKEATQFLREHDSNPEFQAFGKAMVAANQALELQYTKDGALMKFRDPLSDEVVLGDFSYGKEQAIENIQRLKQLTMNGLQYALRPDADPLKAAYWTDFAEHIDNLLMVANPDTAILVDNKFDPLRLLTKHKIGIIVNTTLSRIPGPYALRANRGFDAAGLAYKAKNEFTKDSFTLLDTANKDALRSHPDLHTMEQWRREVAGPIHNSRQYFGQYHYKAGDVIPGYGHVVTPEDMKAIRVQFDAEEFFYNLHEKGFIPAVLENPTRIKMAGTAIQRKAQALGPGTVSRGISNQTRNFLPDQWRSAVENKQVDTFLGTGDNYIRLILGHVLEDERTYFLLGKGRFADDYKALRALNQEKEPMPSDLDDLSEWVADHYNDRLPPDAPKEDRVTLQEARNTLIDEVSAYMNKIKRDTEEKKASVNNATVDIEVLENNFTQERGLKIAPGSLYEYGITSYQDMVRKGNDAVEFYWVRVHDDLLDLRQLLLDERTRLKNLMAERYGYESGKAKRAINRGIRGDDDPVLQNHQMIFEEVDQNLKSVEKILNNWNDIRKRRGDFYGDEMATQFAMPMWGTAVGGVLTNPGTWLVNGSSGVAMWGLKLAEIRKGGWMRVPLSVLNTHLRTFVKASILSMVPKTTKEKMIQRYLLTNPALRHGVIEHFLFMLDREVRDRAALRDMGVYDSYSVRDQLGYDSDKPRWQNIRAAWQALDPTNRDPKLTMRQQAFGFLGRFPRAANVVLRKIGMRWVDNWINSQSTTIANAIADNLRVRAIKAFDNRLENDPVFKAIYDQYGDSFERLSVALAGTGKEGHILTPAELTGRLPHVSAKSAIQLRDTFLRNNDAVDKIMLRYWWNKRNPKGDRNAPFLSDGQRDALMFALAEDVNMATLASRPQFFLGSRGRQMLGTLSQYWLWDTDRLSTSLFSKVKGNATALRYLPALIGFTMATVIVGLFSDDGRRFINRTLFNTLSKNPSFWDATSDSARLKALTANAANFWGAIGSAYNYANDRAAKLGYKNPIIAANMAYDLMGLLQNWWQTGAIADPALNLLARYNPAVRALINRLPDHAGLMEVRKATNALYAGTPETIESKLRQPSSGNDMRSNVTTPMINAIVNAAAQGNWAQADEMFQKAVDQKKLEGNPNPQGSVTAAIDTRRPEHAVYQRLLTSEEHDQVYNNLSPENRAHVDRINGVFDQLKERYAGGTALGGQARAVSSGGLIPLARSGLGLPSARIGFRSLSLRRRTRRDLGLGGIRRRLRLRSSLRL